MACPKLDDADRYVEKLSVILADNDIPVNVVVISTVGEMLKSGAMRP